MYQLLIFYHSISRWLALISILYSIIIACRYRARSLTFSGLPLIIFKFSIIVNVIQLVTGLLIYKRSHITSNFWAQRILTKNFDGVFFSIIHSGCMVIAALSMILRIHLSGEKRIRERKIQHNCDLFFYSIANYNIGNTMAFLALC